MKILPNKCHLHKHAHTYPSLESGVSHTCVSSSSEIDRICIRPIELTLKKKKKVLSMTDSLIPNKGARGAFICCDLVRKYLFTANNVVSLFIDRCQRHIVTCRTITFPSTRWHKGTRLISASTFLKSNMSPKKGSETLA